MIKNSLIRVLLAIYTLCFMSIKFTHASEVNYNQTFDLNTNEWICLQKKMPDLLATKLQLILFTLPKGECRSSKIKINDKSSQTTFPKKSENPKKDKVYTLSKGQLLCISKKIDAIVKSNENYSFQFSKECTGE